MGENDMKISSKIYTGLVLAILFAPILVLLVFSFNESKSLSVFSGFSTKWYRELANDANTLEALRNTLILAASATVISTIMGTAAAVGINKLRSKWYRAAMNMVTDIPMTNPDIITGISLMLMFVFVGRLLGSSTSLSFWTMLIAHVTFCTPYVILQVLPKLQQMDDSLRGAGLDAVALLPEGGDVGGMETVDVFLMADCLDHAVLVDMLRHRELHQDAVDRVVVVERVDELEELLLGSCLGQTDGGRLVSDLLGVFPLRLHIALACGVFTHQNHGQVRGAAIFLHERGHFLRDRLIYLFC